MQDLLTEVRESIATVLDEQCSSLAVHGFIDGREALDTRLRGLATELGWLAISLPEAHGGIGLGAAGLAPLKCHPARAAAPGPFLATSVALEVMTKSDRAGEEPIASLIADVTAGSATLAIAAKLTPSQSDGSAWLLGDITAKAALVVDDGGDIALIDLATAGAERVSTWDETRSIISLPVSRARPIATLRGMRPMLETMYALAIAADSAGAARGTIDRTVSYLKEREQFGRPIGSFQALKHRMADHQVNAIGADQLVWQAAEQVDAAAAGAFLWSAMAKANVTDAVARIAGDCVQLHGGVGFTREYDPHLYLKRVRLNEMLLAPNAALRDAAAKSFGEVLRQGHEVLEIA